MNITVSDLRPHSGGRFGHPVEGVDAGNRPLVLVGAPENQDWPELDEIEVETDGPDLGGEAVNNT